MNLKKFTRILLVLMFCLVLPLASQARDWEKHPAFHEFTRAERVAFIGDIHGAFEEATNTLACMGLIAPLATNTYKVKWTGGKTLLVFMGDLPDRWQYSKECFDMVMDLQEQAPKSGGQVLCIMGNHEVYQINRRIENRARNERIPYETPRNSIMTIESFERAGINYYDAMAKSGKYGSFIRNLPLFLMINGFFVVHAGPPFPPKNRAKLVKEFKEVMEKEIFWWEKSLLFFPYGPLFHREWWKVTDKNIAKDDDFVFKSLRALGAKGCIFGHTPGGMGTLGTINHKYRKLVSTDVGMTPYYRHSHGAGLLMTLDQNDKLTFTAYYPDRGAIPLFQRDYHEDDKPAQNEDTWVRREADEAIPTYDSEASAGE